MTAAQTLMLDRAYMPVGVVGWKVAITLLFQGKAEVVEEYDEVVHSAYMAIKVPAVVKLTGPVRRRRKPVKFSRVNVYGRDDYRCQYCGNVCTMRELTYDHVTPRSQGGKTNWTNIVSCCVPCNAKKAGQTPEQAKMRLLKKPVQPVDLPSVVIPVSRHSIPEAWRDYVWWAGKLEQD